MDQPLHLYNSPKDRARQYVLTLLVGATAGLSAAMGPYGLAAACGFTCFIFIGIFPLLMAVELSAMFLPFQRLLAVDLGPFNLKVSQLIFMGILMRIVLGKLVTRQDKIVVARFTTPLLLFAVVSALSVSWSPNPVYSTAMLMWQWFSVMLAHAVMNIVVTRDRLEKAVRYVIYGGILVSVFGIYQFIAEFVGLPSFMREEYRTNGVYMARVHSTALEPLHYASYLVIILSMCLALYLSNQDRISKRLTVTAMTLASANLLLTLSRGGYIGFMIAAVVIWRSLGRNSRNKARTRALGKILAVSVVICIILIFALSLGSLLQSTIHEGAAVRAGSSAERMLAYNVAVTLFLTHPLTGTGIGSFGDLYLPDQRAFVNNTPLEIAAETGLIGIACFVWFCISVWKTLKLTIRRSTNNFDRSIAVGLFGALAGLAVQYLTVSPCYAEWTWFTIGLSGCISNLVLSQKNQAG